VVLEPIRRDSGPAIAAGAAFARQRDPDAIVLAIAADHVILDADLFADACRAGRDAAAKGHIVTFGIRPTAPKTSYGYVRRGEALGFEGVSRVAAFVEKPDAATAATYVAQDYLWNSGNFLFRADALLAELARFEPAMAEAVEKAGRRRGRRSRLCSSRRAGLRPRATEIDRLRGDGEDRTRGRGRGPLPLV